MIQVIGYQTLRAWMEDGGWRRYAVLSEPPGKGDSPAMIKSTGKRL